jgi:15-cis-phytoene synthase
MNLPEITFLPPQRLALAYTKQDLRLGFGLLLALDDRLEQIFRKAGEPLIAQMRLAWWNDVIPNQCMNARLGNHCWLF